jgi:hypothetical protein
VMGFESATAGVGTAGAGFAALTFFSSQPVTKSADTHVTANNPISAFDFWLGIYLFSSANG